MEQCCALACQKFLRPIFLNLLDPPLSVVFLSIVDAWLCKLWFWILDKEIKHNKKAATEPEVDLFTSSPPGKFTEESSKTESSLENVSTFHLFCPTLKQNKTLIVVLI